MAVYCTPRVVNPGLAVRIFSKLCISRPAPTSKIKLRETCTRTSPERTHARPPPPTTPAASILSECARSILLVCMAGTTPKSTVVSRHTPALSARTRQSSSPGKCICTPPRAGKSSTSKWRHQYASSRPPVAPKRESTRPSVSNCFHRRARPAPTARRTLISWRRAHERTRSKLPTFAQAISRTNATTAIMISSVGSSVPALLKGVCHRILDEWKGYHKNVLRRKDVVMHDVPSRRIRSGVYAGYDGDRPTKNLDATVHELAPHTTTTVHRHSWDAIEFVESGRGWTEIDGQRLDWRAWDPLHLPSWAWHRHGNEAGTRAVFHTWSVEPMLEQFGVALFED